MDFEGIELGLRQSPLIQEMHETMDADPSRFDSAAKRQHYVPQHLLRGFATPHGSGNRRFTYQLDVRCGTPRRVDVADAASSRYFYAWTAEGGTRNNQIEGFLAWVEGYAAPALSRFLADPENLSDGDRGTLSFFFALQYQRTPEAAKMTAATGDVALRMLFASEFSDRAAFARTYRAALPDRANASEDEIERFRLELLEDLRSGAVAPSDPQAHALQMGLRLSSETLYFIYGMSWELLIGDHFVTSDRGMALHDPTPTFPWSSEGLLSSDDAETTIPLSASACLVLGPRGDSLRVQEANERRMADINLRMYGWAGHHIFGRTQEDVVGVRQLAKTQPASVPRPRPRRIPFLIEADPSDDTLARRNVARGWPPYLWSDGVPHDYIVIDEGQNPVDAALLTSAKVVERARRTLALQAEQELEGRERTTIIPPDKVVGAAATTSILGEWREFRAKHDI